MMGTKANGWLFLKPAGAGAKVTEQGIVALKTQNGAAASSQISSMVGKTFTVGKAPMATGNVAGKWIMLKPAISGGLAKGGAAATTAVVTNEAINKSAATKGVATVKGAGAANTAKDVGVQGITAVKEPATKSTITKSMTTKSAVSKGAVSKAATKGAATTGKALISKAPIASVGSGLTATTSAAKGESQQPAQSGRELD